MLATIQADPSQPGQRPDFVDWLSLERRGGADTDAGMHRHHLDPTEPFARAVASPAHGLLITSATLRDEGEAEDDDPEATWRDAEARTGASHLPIPAIRAAMASPFDYAARTRCLVIPDVAKENTGQVAFAFPADDIGIRNSVQRFYGLDHQPSEAEVRELGRPWAPYSSLACYYLWPSPRAEWERGR